MLQRYRRGYWPWLGVCLVASAAILIVMPAEKSIGWVIKIVYLHGALSRAGLAGFVLAGVAGALYLARRTGSACRWSWALLLSGWLFWVSHFVVSMPATRLTWGPWIAWGEPRVTMTLQVGGVGLAIILVSRLMGSSHFMAAANILLAGATLLQAESTGVLRHPLDPIGSSSSPVLRAAYLILLIPIVSSMILVASSLARSRHASWLEARPDRPPKEG